MPAQRMFRRLLALAGLCALAGGALAACGRSATGPAAAGSPTLTARPSPAPTITTIRNSRSLPAGRTATVIAQAGVSLRLTASRPRTSRTRLSPSYGHPPARGYYVTFTLTIRNTGKQPVDLGPLNFFVHVAGQGDVTSYQGNAPYSGASSQLDNTEIEPGQTLAAPLTFDVRSPHGTLAYAPDSSPAVVWRF